MSETKKKIHVKCKHAEKKRGKVLNEQIVGQNYYSQNTYLLVQIIIEVYVLIKMSKIDFFFFAVLH